MRRDGCEGSAGEARGRILGRNWDQSLQSFHPCYSQSPLLWIYPPPPLSKRRSKLVCDVNIVYGSLKSENSQDYLKKPQQNFTFMNFASGHRINDDECGLLTHH
jgi:hypothetical protein